MNYTHPMFIERNSIKYGAKEFIKLNFHDQSEKISRWVLKKSKPIINRIVLPSKPKPILLWLPAQ
jgi:hypothetical protein